MSTITIPINAQLEEVIDSLLQESQFETKAGVVRHAITRLAEEEALERVLRAEREIKEGKGLTGNLRDLVDKI